MADDMHSYSKKDFAPECLFSKAEYFMHGI